jgi:hypothetical protein
LTLEEASLTDGRPVPTGTYSPWVLPIGRYDRLAEQSARAADDEDREEGKQLHRLRRPTLDSTLPRYG